MSAPAYATLDDLAQWVDDDLPTTSPAILRSAAYAVADEVALAVYSTDPSTGLPTDPALIAAFRDATCAQAAWLITNDIDAFSGGATARLEDSVAIGSARVNYADAADAAAARRRGLDGLCPEACRILAHAGLTNIVLNVPGWWAFRATGLGGVY